MLQGFWTEMIWAFQQKGAPLEKEDYSPYQSYRNISTLQYVEISPPRRLTQPVIWVHAVELKCKPLQMQH